MKLPLTCKGSIIYEYEEDTDDCDMIRYWKFEIDYQVWAAEPMVMYDRDGGGYPGSPPMCEIQGVRCLEIDDNKHPSIEDAKKAADWFSGMMDIGNKIFDDVCELCFEDANSKYDD